MSSARRFVHHSSARFSGGMSLYLRTDQSELHQFCFFICQRRIHFLNCRVGHFLYFFLRATIVIFTDRFIFQQSFYFIVRITADVRTATRACSASPRTIFVRSLRRSSVSGGSGTRMSVPAELGFKPRSDAMIAFSTAGPIERSNTLIFKVRESSTVTLANWRSGVGVP